MLSATWQDDYIWLLEERVFAPVSSFWTGALLAPRAHLRHKAVPCIFIHCDDVGIGNAESCIYSYAEVPMYSPASRSESSHCRGAELWLNPRVLLARCGKAAEAVHDGDMSSLTRLNTG